jgi:hypothetical protein
LALSWTVKYGSFTKKMIFQILLSVLALSRTVKCGSFTKKMIFQILLSVLALSWTVKYGSFTKKRERPGTHCIGGWVGPQGPSGWVWKFSPSTGIRSPDRPARS